ncbi:MAG TPA: metallopeptidase TldD-related protein [Candidatus Baltobacteraceae bacterium]|jgi:TldD protein|nr:metallopeptidase TldD-related protein [Candidatus Baltobacteraceae bacterium]
MLDTQTLDRLLKRALRYGGDYADIFCEFRTGYSFRLQDGRIHEGSSVISQGVGIRVLLGETAGYAYSDDLSMEALLRAADAASLVARTMPSGEGHTVDLRSVSVPPVYDQTRTAHADASRYVGLLEAADIAARAHDPRIVAVNAHVSDELQNVWIATSDGRYVHDHRPLVTLGIQAVASRNGERASGYGADGGRTSIAFFDNGVPQTLATDAARIAVTNVDAAPAPAGEMEMVVGSGGGGVLLHEAVGHGLESDFNRRGTSLYAGRVGERVASELVTIYDDGNLPEERGSVTVDDEGVPGQHKVLVENGVLRGYMQDTLNARLMGVQSTGSGRRQSFRFLPQPRMCNTYMPNGDSSVEDIIASTKRGLYAKSFAGGQVEISKGDFVFMVAEGYLIENGKITTPVRNATIVGNGPDAMTKVVAVGNDSRLARRHYTCGKGGQHVPVGVGMPTVKISSITVGGTGA